MQIFGLCTGNKSSPHRPILVRGVSNMFIILQIKDRVDLPERHLQVESPQSSHLFLNKAITYLTLKITLCQSHQ